MHMPQGTRFVDAVGIHRQGVARFNLWSSNFDIFRSLATWARLRWFCLEGGNIDDERLALIVSSCPNLQTLEMDEFSPYKGGLTPQGIRALRSLPHLKRLHLGWYKLNIEHMRAIAELTQLEELSLEDPLDDASVAPLQSLPKLKRINLERTKVSDRSFSAIRGDWQTNRAYRT